MRACLNPHGGHSARSITQRQIVCSTPGCGFLLEEAPIGPWHVISLFKQGPAADLYLAVEARAPMTSRASMLVKVLRGPIVQPAPRAEAALNQLAALRHSHIHPIQGRGWTSPGGALYLLSPYEAYGSLQYQPAERQRLPPPTVAALVRQIAEALHYAHERQMTHGRLKLENCLVVGPATVQVSDFYQPLLAHEDFTIAPYYVAPEQFLNQAVPASDQYALAIITYQLLTAHFPFPETEPLAVMAQQLQRDPLPISAFRSDLPRIVDATLRRALSKHPPDRFPTVLAFAMALHHALEDGPRITSALDVSHRAAPQKSPEAQASTPQVLRIPTPMPGGAVRLCLLPGHTAEATVLRWAADGMHLASAGADQTVRLWRIQKHIGTPLAVLEGHTARVLALSWSPDGALLASAAADATLRIWDVSQFTRQAGGSSLGRAYKVQAAWWGHDGAASALDWSPDGAYLASGGADRTIRLWDVAGKAIGAWQAHGRGGVSALAWSAERNLLASGGVDHQVMLWNPTTRSGLLTCVGHQDEIHHLAWSADNRQIAASAGRKDARIRVWDAQTGQQKAAVGGNTREVVGICWPPDSSWLAVASADRWLRFWSIDQPSSQRPDPPVELERTPLAMAGAPHSGLIAFGLADMMILVLRLTA